MKYLSNYSHAFNHMIHTGEITADDILAGRVLPLELGRSVDLMTDEELIERVTIGLQTSLFYLIFYPNASPLSGGFLKLMNNIEMKYYPPNRDDRANRDFSIVGVVGPPDSVTYVLLKKTRITKDQIWDVIFSYLSPEEKATTLAELRKQGSEDPNKDIIPLTGQAPYERDIIMNTLSILSDCRNKIFGKE